MGGESGQSMKCLRFWDWIRFAFGFGFGFILTGLKGRRVGGKTEDAISYIKLHAFQIKLLKISHPGQKLKVFKCLQIYLFT